jgi:L-iditol 2-dehydrogenase
MKGLVKEKEGYGNMNYRLVDNPEVSGDLVKIKVAYTGICGSDIHTYKWEYKNSKTPVTLGHEFSGIVSEVGPKVTKVKVGDRVTSETTFTTCGTCQYCLSKDYNLCSNRLGIGTQANGSMTDYVLTREESCHVLPENVSYKEAALTEPLACCVHAALEKTTISENDVVLVIGPGPIGLLLAQVAKAQGATVALAGITKDKHRLDLGIQLGIDYIVDTQENDLAEFTSKFNDGEGMNQVGLFAKKMNEMDQESIIQREVEYIGSRSQKPTSWGKSLKLLSDKKIDAEKMITKVYPLNEWETAFNAVMSGNEIKVLLESNLDWNKE